LKPGSSNLLLGKDESRPKVSVSVKSARKACDGSVGRVRGSTAGVASAERRSKRAREGRRRWRKKRERGREVE
jgi:hypothetical protein